MIYKLIEDEKGQYIGTNGKRYTLLEAETYIDDASGRNVDCVYLADLQAAMGYFGVVPIDNQGDGGDESQN